MLLLLPVCDSPEFVISSFSDTTLRLTFTSTSIAGKKMIVQATNVGADVGEGQFDLAIPGGGVGLFNACTDQWGEKLRPNLISETPC